MCFTTDGHGRREEPQHQEKPFSSLQFKEQLKAQLSCQSPTCCGLAHGTAPASRALPCLTSNPPSTLRLHVYLPSPSALKPFHLKIKPPRYSIHLQRTPYCPATLGDFVALTHASALAACEATRCIIKGSLKCI